MKKILSIFAMAAILCGTFAACDTIGKDDEGTDGTEQTPGGEEKPQPSMLSVEKTEVTETGVTFTINSNSKDGYAYGIIDFMSSIMFIDEETFEIDEAKCEEYAKDGQIWSMFTSYDIEKEKSFSIQAVELPYLSPEDCQGNLGISLKASFIVYFANVDANGEVIPSTTAYSIFEPKWNATPFEEFPFPEM